MIKTILKINKFFTFNEVPSSRKKNIKDFEHFSDFLELARNQMNKHGLIDWTLDLDYAKVRGELVFLEKRKFLFLEIL